MNELVTLPCGHRVTDDGGLEVACSICHKVYQRVGLPLKEDPDRFRLPAPPARRIRL